MTDLSGEDILAKLLGKKSGASSDSLSGEDILTKLLASKPTPSPGVSPFPPETDETRRIGDLMTPGPPTSTAPSIPQPSGGAYIPGASGPPPGLNLGEIGGAAREGYAGGQMVTPAGVALADKYGLGMVPRGINLLSGAMGGLYGGARDVVGQTVDSVLPGAGRDATTGLDLAMPFAGQGPGLPLHAGNLLAARARGADAALMRDTPPRFISEIYAPQPAPGISILDRINQLIAHDNAETAGNSGAMPPAPPQPAFVLNPQGGNTPAFVPPGARIPQPASPAFVPPQTTPPGQGLVPPGMIENKLATAARPPENAPTPPPLITPPPSGQTIPNGLTPAQIAEFKNIPDALPPADGPIRTPADAEARADQIVRHFASIGNKAPIPGAEGALPTITGNSGLATLYRAVRDSDTPVPFTTLENASKSNAMGQLRTMAGTEDDLKDAISARATTVGPMYKKAFANKTEADFEAPTQTAQDILKSPAGQNDTVAAELPSIMKKLKGQTDPEQLKGISDNIDATLDRLGTEGKADRETRRALGTIKESIMSSISDAAPGFDAAQAEFSRQSRRIDEMKYLQGRKLTDLQGNPTLGNMRSTLDDIDKKQAGDKFHPADSVTPENMQTLQRLHDQMQREQLTQSAGKALGSNTFQNLATSGRVGTLAGSVGNALVGGAVGGGIDLAAGHSGMGGFLVGNALGAAAKHFAERGAAKDAARADAGRQMLMEALRDRMLNIDNKGVRALSP